MRCALLLLESQPGLEILARSALYETPPLGPPQPDYLNAALRVSFAGSVEALFAITQAVEKKLGRERRERWGARTLDIDILHWSEGAVHTAALTIPHPGLLSRNFALAPLLDVMPEAERSVHETLASLGGAPPTASPAWLEPTPLSEPLLLPAGLEDAELACLVVGAVGRCGLRPEAALECLPFVQPRLTMDAQSLRQFVAHREELVRQGFWVRDAAITQISDLYLRGFWLGEQADPREIGPTPHFSIDARNTHCVIVSAASAPRR